jgi:hypothetical protein
MAVDFETDGPEALRNLARLLRTQSDGKELKKKFVRELRTAGKPAADALRAALIEGLPKRGGAARSFRNARWGARNRLTGENAGIRMVSNKKHDYASINRGRLRHPAYPDPARPRKDWRWADQQVPALRDFFDETIDELRPEMREAILRAIDSLLDEIERGI